MSTTALTMMLFTQGVITFVTLYFFYRVLTAKDQKPSE